MKEFTISLILITSSIVTSGQSYNYNSIPKEQIAETAGSSRAGSCASPNGDIVCDDLTAYPTYAELVAGGCCFAITPPVKDATYCWEFTAINTTVTLDCGFSVLCFGGCGWTFLSFQLYTCTPACVLVGTGLTFTGLTVGQCYTWCFTTDMTGGGPGGGFDQFCPYVIQTPLLPVELTSFICVPGEEVVTLNWQTASEVNCAAFDVFRSSDGITFQLIGSVAGNGSTSTPQGYTFTDENPVQGLQYYRLGERDFEGNISYSEVIACVFAGNPGAYIYYNLLGERIDPENATGGVYIRESSNGSAYSRQLVYNR